MPFATGTAQPGRGAHGIGKSHTVARQKGLLALIGAHGPVAEIFFQSAQTVRVLHKWSVGHARHGFFGQIIVRGPQAAGSDYEIAALQGFLQGRFQPPGIVAHYMGMEQIHA